MPFVFAYGGNTNPNQLRKQYVSHRVVGVGRLEGYELAFHSYACIGECESKMTKLETSYCNVRNLRNQGSLQTSSKIALQNSSKDHNNKVIGLIVELSPEDLDKMDQQECLGCIYERNLREITLMDSQDVYRCFVYEMINPVESGVMPSERYLNVVRIGYEHFGIPFHQLPLN